MLPDPGRPLSSAAVENGPQLLAGLLGCRPLGCPGPPHGIIQSPPHPGVQGRIAAWYLGGREVGPASAGKASPRSAAVCSLLLPGPGRAARRLAELALRDRPIKNSVPETLIFALKFSSKYSPAGVCHTPLLRGACVRVCGGSGSGRSPHVVPTPCGSWQGPGAGAAQGPARPSPLCSPRALVRPSRRLPGHSPPLPCAQGEAAGGQVARSRRGLLGQLVGPKWTVDAVMNRRPEHGEAGPLGDPRPPRSRGAASAPPSPAWARCRPRAAGSGRQREAEQALRRPCPLLSFRGLTL